MNVPRYLLAVVVVGVVMNLFDILVHGFVLRGYYLGLTGLLRGDAPMTWLVLGEFVAAAVFLWVFDRVYACFGGGVKGGFAFGFYAGVLVSFPTFIYDHLLIQGFPYHLAWVWTAVGIAWGLLAGAVAGAIYKK